MKNLAIVCLLAVNLGFAYCENESAREEKPRDFKLTVIVLTMNRHFSLMRLLRSLNNTEFDHPDDYFDMEIHVDKSIGEHYEECVK